MREHCKSAFLRVAKVLDRTKATQGIPHVVVRCVGRTGTRDQGCGKLRYKLWCILWQAISARVSCHVGTVEAAESR